jgi:hypothetical protein
VVFLDVVIKHLDHNLYGHANHVLYFSLSIAIWIFGMAVMQNSRNPLLDLSRLGPNSLCP